MKPYIWKYIGLSLLSAILFSLPWRLPAVGWLLLFAFIPLFWIEADFAARKAKGGWKYYALAFLLWNAITTYWIYKATLWGGITAVVANAFQMFFIFSLFCLVKRKTTPKIGYTFLVALWIAWEYLYFNAEISWPWLVLGNGFSNTTFLVQWYEYTGVLGGSLWVFLTNISLFWWLRRKPEGRVARYCLNASLAALLVLPAGISVYRFYTYQEAGAPIEVVVLQPNIDPYKEKFSGMTQEEQDLRLLELATEAIRPGTRYLFAPESFVGNVLENNMLNDSSFKRFYQFLQDHPHTVLIVGAISTYFYPVGAEAPTETAKQIGDGRWYDYFNAAFQLSDGVQPFVYHKSKLVPAAEKQPYAKYLKWLNRLAIDLGGTVGTFGTQSKASIFPAPWNRDASDSLSPLYIGVAICYESVYGEYFSSYVQRGAGLMSVITNDGWWGNLPGYRQHLSYSRLRAIETRRCIARSANTGISALINQRGDYIEKSAWWEEAWLRGDLHVNHKLTFYVRYGDWIGRISTYLLLLLLGYGLVLWSNSRVARKNQRAVKQRGRRD